MPIQKMNRLAQISILQALVSSPEALMAQLSKMANKGPAPAALAAQVRAIVERMQSNAKLQGLDVLIQKLQLENPERHSVDHSDHFVGPPEGFLNRTQRVGIFN